MTGRFVPSASGVPGTRVTPFRPVQLPGLIDVARERSRRGDALSIPAGASGRLAMVRRDEVPPGARLVRCHFPVRKRPPVRVTRDVSSLYTARPATLNSASHR